MDDKRSRFRDAEANQIIGRAAELDAERVSAVDVDSLREIAQEAGISSSALDQALREHELSKGQAPVATSRWKQWRVMAIVMVVVIMAFLFMIVARAPAPPPP